MTGASVEWRRESVGPISPSRQALTACAFRFSGTVQMMWVDVMICRTVMDTASRGTSSKALEPPLPELLSATGVVELHDDVRDYPW